MPTLYIVLEKQDYGVPTPTHDQLNRRVVSHFKKYRQIHCIMVSRLYLMVTSLTKHIYAQSTRLLCDGDGLEHRARQNGWELLSTASSLSQTQHLTRKQTIRKRNRISV